MTPIWLSLLLSGFLLAAGGAQAADPTLKLSQGEVFSDPVGTVVEVTIRNEGANPVGSALVTCAFSAAGKPAGSASTRLYNLLPGGNGTDQVHMMGAKANVASCEITSTTPATN